MSLAGEFRSDNAAPAHPAVLEAIAAANAGGAGAYGNDDWTRRADAWFKDQLGGHVESFLVWNGTGWGAFLADGAAAPSDLRYYRLDADGRRVRRQYPGRSF